MLSLLFAVLIQDPYEMGRQYGLNRELPMDERVEPNSWYGTPGLRPRDNWLQDRRPPQERWRDRSDPDVELERFEQLFDRRYRLPRRDIP
jgi:hypothetical protein